MDLQKLKTELATDPVALGYAGKTAAQKAALLNTTMRTRNRAALPAIAIWGRITDTEYATLGADTKALFQAALSAGSIDMTDGAVKSKLSAMFSQATAPTTRAAIIALMSESVPRATELGLGTVTAQDVTDAEAA